jgi:hypothetical protein
MQTTAVVTDIDGVRFDGELIGEVATHAPKNHLAFYYVCGIEELIGKYATRSAAVNALAEMHRASVVLQAVATELRRCDTTPAAAAARPAYVRMPTLAETHSKPNDVRYILERLAERIENFRAEAKRNIAQAQAEIPRTKDADTAYDIAQATREIVADIQVQDIEVQDDLEAIASIITSIFEELYSEAYNADEEAHLQLEALQLEEDQHENIVLRG